MDAVPATFPAHVIPLVELFASRSVTPLHETFGEECHAFEIYDTRNALVREAAYARALARRFEPHHELEDWLAAEHEVDASLFAELAPVGFVG
jgi:hypothetical protein